MRKNIIALACLGAIATAGSAQAQTTINPTPASALTFYGIVDEALRLDSDSTAAGSKFAFTDGMVSTSRLGLRGNAPLASGLQATIALEAGIKLGSGRQGDANSLFDRKATIGLEGSWGKLDFGRDSTFGWEYTPFYDPMGGALAQPNPVSRGSATTGLLVNGMMFNTNNPYSDTKLRDNNIKYTYKDDSGLIVGAAISTGGVAGAVTRNSSEQLALGYSKDAINVIAAYDFLRDATDQKQEVFTLGGNYTFGNKVKATLGLSQLKADGGFTPTANQVATAVGAFYNTAWGVPLNGSIQFNVTALGVEYPFTPQLTVTSGFYNVHVTGTGLKDNDYNSVMVMAKYDLQALQNAFLKKTFVYAAIDTETATRNGNYSNGNGGSGNTGLTIGIQTRF